MATKAKPAGGGRKRRTVQEILRASPKMPPTRARRLEELLQRGNFGKLTPEEDRELRDLVDHVNRQTFLMLARIRPTT
jgi:hypothetical protein